MAAPTGNRFWELRSKHGRDKIFKTPSVMWSAACEYFKWCEDNPFIEEDFVSGGPAAGTKVRLNKMRPFTIEGLTLHLHCNVGYFNDFDEALKTSKAKNKKDFSFVVTRIREVIRNQKFSGAAAGFFNASIISQDLGMRNKTDLDLSTLGKEVNMTPASEAALLEIVAKINANAAG